MTRATIAIATNNGDIGGGEVMLLNIVHTLESLGHRVLVIGPRAPGDLVTLARERGVETTILDACTGVGYMTELFRWRLRHRRIPLWCNGLVPSFATSGLGPRLVHLHIAPRGLQRLAARIACCGARAVLVPSRFMESRVPGSRPIGNWTEDIPFTAFRETAEDGSLRVGFLGRMTREKGVDVLARALQQVPEIGGRTVRLVIAGANRFGDPTDDRLIDDALEPLALRTTRLGWVERQDFFSAVDLAVFPSVWEESFGLVAAEAMAAGVPFVITDSGALPEVAGPDHPWIARRGDPVDLARVISRALRESTRGDERRSAAARSRWEQQFSPGAGERRVARLLRDLSSRGPTTEARRGR